ncbi:hypothetical protein I7I51_00119 [Histoplasma capsulatum]|uniref:Uncharacterized protein n=1 Tax=Ajellomyces capsulatus TaxID=5037 RepID=A0A8A1MEW0_AJECA|nr:predicted protein [Histoplasma mississippiense (nom. inval.)]EDN08497.1 predicted protein [Histoplasma mississippiense (nom. inval.)]QSS63062.1 hypothetical protein I7I51_00119 [Histoplasma capsulatum]
MEVGRSAKARCQAAMVACLSETLSCSPPKSANYSSTKYARIIWFEPRQTINQRQSLETFLAVDLNRGPVSARAFRQNDPSKLRTYQSILVVKLGPSGDQKGPPNSPSIAERPIEIPITILCASAHSAYP